jgi:hypothetical protein
LSDLSETGRTALLLRVMFFKVDTKRYTSAVSLLERMTRVAKELDRQEALKCKRKPAGRARKSKKGT